MPVLLLLLRHPQLRALFLVEAVPYLPPRFIEAILLERGRERGRIRDEATLLGRGRIRDEAVLFGRGRIRDEAILLGRAEAVLLGQG